MYRTVLNRGRNYGQIVKSRLDREKKQTRIQVIRQIGSDVEKDEKRKLLH
jgi:hypothetical protein